MKRGLLLLLLFGITGVAASREVIPLNDRWSFLAGFQTGAEVTHPVTLPHTWNLDALASMPDYRRGTGIYERRLDIPEEWRGRRIFIRFYGAANVADVILNGRYLGQHRGGTTAFVFELTPHVNPAGRNLLRVLVSNAPRTDVLPVAQEGNAYGGLFREAELIVTDPLAVTPAYWGADGVLVRSEVIGPQAVEGSVEVRLLGSETERTAHLQMAICSPRGDTVALREARCRIVPSDTENRATIPFRIERPVLWNVGHGAEALYRIVIRVSGSGGPTDSIAVRTGFRDVGVSAAGAMMLNGERLPVRGVVLRGDRPAHGSALTPDQVAADLEVAVEMGANTVRTAGGARSPYFYTWCDEQGIAVWSELPFTGSPYLADQTYFRSSAFHEQARQQLCEMIVQHYNHPSIVWWGLFSDLPVRGDDPTPFVRILDSLAHALDRSRLTGASSNQDGSINDVPDLIVWNQSLGWRSGEPGDLVLWRDQLHRDYPRFRSGVNYIVGGDPSQHDSISSRPDPRSGRHPETWQTYCHEHYVAAVAEDSLLWGYFAGNLFDFGAARRVLWGGSGIDDSGLVTFDRTTRKDAYYLYKALWNGSEPTVYLTERRWSRRDGTLQNLTVYSGLPFVELRVNGLSLGTKQGEGPVFRWEGVELQRGPNRIEAIGSRAEGAPGVHDAIEVTVGRTLRATEQPPVLRRTANRGSKD